MSDSVQDYWKSVVVPNMDAYQAKVCDQTAWNYSVSLYHVVDWLAGGDDARKHALFKELVAKCQNIQLLQDICDTRKHFSLRNKERSVAEAAQVKVSAATYGGATYGVDKYNVTYGVVNTPEGKLMLAHILEDCRNVLYSYVTGPV